MRQIAIALGYSHLDFFSVVQLLEKYTVPARFCAKAISDGRDSPYGPREGQAVAKEMAVLMSKEYDAPLCIGIVAVRFMPLCASARPASMDIAVLVERGNLKEPIQLTPQTTHNAALPSISELKRPNESHYAQEALRTLLETLKLRSKALHLI